ncbi:LmbE family N-acetylglucosaminyl deacetylase [Streptomyces sp. SAI-133]|uniref:PIG-L family deacetylase n=1 Tax=Streptomyces sp. SAI-133 TaxID=2940547 RepID=UPI002475BEDE|nr:PIG-L family deacetylase [Streptomyces sp. SAI-133]MDH6590047.1 LmbE family N-acetylglucosaminyl deacetylase [Streptomyces sp. SAI-133]
MLFSHLGKGSTTLVLTAHPDDEVFAHGAAIAMLSQQGSRVVLRTASGGEAAENDVTSTAEARRRRSARLDAACTRLGVHEWNWLAEGRWTDTAGRPTPGSLTTASVSDLAEVIADQIQTIIPDVLLTVGPDGLTGHPDHILIHRAVATAAASCDVPVFGSYLLPADIAQGRDLLATILPGEHVGSGRMTGRDEPSPATLAAPAHAAEARRAALDEYANGLGALALKNLVRVFPGRGDSLLLRAVLDAIGWQTERYTHPVT